MFLYLIYLPSAVFVSTVSLLSCFSSHLSYALLLFKLFPYVNATSSSNFVPLLIHGTVDVPVLTNTLPDTDSTSSKSSDSEGSPEDSNGLTVGLVGFAIAIIVTVAIVFLILFLQRSEKKRRKTQHNLDIERAVKADGLKHGYLINDPEDVAPIKPDGNPQEDDNIGQADKKTGKGDRLKEDNDNIQHEDNIDAQERLQLYKNGGTMGPLSESMEEDARQILESDENKQTVDKARLAKIDEERKKVVAMRSTSSRQNDPNRPRKTAKDIDQYQRLSMASPYQGKDVPKVTVAVPETVEEMDKPVEEWKRSKEICEKMTSYVPAGLLDDQFDDF